MTQIFHTKKLAHFISKTENEETVYPIQQNYVTCYGYDVQ
jgi:hypothetical protein